MTLLIKVFKFGSFFVILFRAMVQTYIYHATNLEKSIVRLVTALIMYDAALRLSRKIRSNDV